MFSACHSLLNFEPSEDISWQINCNERISIEEMLIFIGKCIDSWETLKLLTQVSQLNEFNVEFKVLFITKTCEQEDVGLSDINIIRKIIQDTEYSWEFDTDSKYKKYLETRNLCEAYDIVHNIGKIAHDDSLNGLLEIEAFINNVHLCLMKGLRSNTPAGQFSIDVRITLDLDGETLEYVKFNTHADARNAVMRVLDRYNALYFTLKTGGVSHGDKDFLRSFFKCVGWLYYNLIMLHPFGDGNGRLCRLILSYVLESVIHIPMPLSGLATDKTREIYLNALVMDRKTDNFPRQLTTLIIESTYLFLKKFINELNIQC